MGISKPYKRTARIFIDNTYSESGKWMYIRHPDYADSPMNFIRAFLLIQKDIFELFNFIEPSDINLKTFSHRIHELLLRTCVEIEANCTAILRENGYTRSGDWNMSDYKKIEESHYLSQYEVKIPNWDGLKGIRKPFDNWNSINGSTKGSLNWYQSYNHTKHDRHLNFKEANFENLMDAVCGLSALLASQFLDNDFSFNSSPITGNFAEIHDGYEDSIGGFFRVKYPTLMPDSEKYDFEHKDIDFKTDIFQQFSY